MFSKLFSTDTKPGAFFRRIDWTAFWSATIISFLVYFFTLGPSVGLEDSGELATAADHLGVPHPPGYPFWTLCCWIFCRLFSWVTYMGQPTPAWAVSLFSAVAGAFAAGCTAMLICRSGSDMLDSIDADRPDGETRRRHNAWMALAGGIGGSLAFAFSPVEWSQSTIVEIYSLNALFLMAVFLLTYRWMRKPSDNVLWITAFIFGLGLTNYQVLLLAAVPLVIIIFFRNISLWLDFVVILLPVALTAQLLGIGAKMKASAQMSADVICKLNPLERADCPNEVLLWLGCVLLVAAPLVGYVLRHRLGDDGTRVQKAALGVGFAGVGLLLLAPVLGHPVAWRTPEELACAPLMTPWKYVCIGALLATSFVLSLGAVFAPHARDWRDGRVKGYLIAALLAAAVACICALGVKHAQLDGYEGERFSYAASFLCLILGLLVVVFRCGCTPRGLAFAVPVFGVQVTTYILLERGAMNGLTSPHTWWFFWPIVWNFAMLALAFVALPSGRSAATALFCAELGVSFYAYMPIVSDLRNPAMNWGYPRTWEGFKHAITRGQYEAITFPNIFSAEGLSRFLHQLGFYFQDLRMQFTLVAAALALLPFTLVKMTVSKAKSAATYLHGTWLALPLYVIVAGLVIAFSVDVDGEVPLRLDKWVLLPLALLALFGLVVLGLRQLYRVLAIVLDAVTNLPLFGKILLWVLLLPLCILAYAAYGLFHEPDDGKGRIPLLQRIQFEWELLFFWLILPLLAYVVSRLAPGTLLAQTVWSVVCVLNVVAILAYFILGLSLRLTEGGREDTPAAKRPGLPPVRSWFAFLADNVTQQWLLGIVSCFAIMSFFLVALAGVKGDIQDGFIQKVKFISSHGMFSLWIGYGIAVGIAVAHRWILPVLFKSRPKVQRGVLIALCVLGALVAAIPVYENYTNDKLVFAMGSAEQNGHTFGWQFGNYQLRGANAIREELAPDEEPLPNPLWPEEMGPGAIFFGGTDPGRFVPTYMIYSAKVRPDVYLITQNALADDTYMSVERDLYGDEIWIPSKEDSAESFNIYVSEVQSGKRPANADLRIENGRVQVTGALGVMEINGVLTRMMFDHERLRHDFYVEESYVIPWMYPFLTPHGLIMKINPNEHALTPAIVRNDMDFWDWYQRRLLHDPAFRRDFAAQKSFSKLRAAIAGLYAHAGYYTVADQAFREAVLLYPASPEATFRYAQEVMIPMQRWDAITDLLDYTDRVDPNNTRTGQMRNYITKARALAANIDRLQTKATKAPLTADESISLAQSLLQMGRAATAAETVRKVLATPDADRFDIGYTCAALLSQCNQRGDAANALKRVLPALPSNVSPRDLVYMVEIFQSGGMTAEAESVLNRAIRLLPKDATLWLQLALIRDAQGDVQAAQQAVIQAYRANREVFTQRVQSDERLFRIAEPLFRRH